MTRDTYLTRSRVERLAATLTEREQAIVGSLGLVRMLTAHQVERLHFTAGTALGNARRCRRTLRHLTELRVVARVDRAIGGARGGSGHFTYALDVAGQRLLTRDSGRSPRRPASLHPFTLRHGIAVGEVYVRLVEAERRGKPELVEFVGEPRRSFAGRDGAPGILCPDAYVRVGVGPDEWVWFVEVDCGTEAPVTLARKCDAHRHYWQAGREIARQGIHPRVLWLAPSDRRLKELVDVVSRQPADAQPLFVVAPFDAAVRVLAGGTL